MVCKCTSYKKTVKIDYNKKNMFEVVYFSFFQIRVRLQYFGLDLDPDSGTGIQQLSVKRFYADPDPQPLCEWLSLCLSTLRVRRLILLVRCEHILKVIFGAI